MVRKEFNNQIPVGLFIFLLLSEPQDYICAQCNESTTTAAELIEHISEKHGVVLCKEVKTLPTDEISWQNHLPLQYTDKHEQSPLFRLHQNHPVHPKHTPAALPISLTLSYNSYFLHGHRHYLNQELLRRVHVQNEMIGSCLDEEEHNSATNLYG